ncbi:MAG: acetyltransferase [Halobacteriota archaeon]
MQLVCLGANNPSIFRHIRAKERLDRDFHFLGFIDNDEEKWGKCFVGYPVFGGIDKVDALRNDDVFFCNLITRDCVTRYETTKSLLERMATLANVVYPAIDLEMVEFGVGNYVQESVVLQPGVCLGNNSSITVGTTVAHECIIGNSVFIAGGCHLSGKITIESGAFIGTGATILPRLIIGEWSIIGAGTVVTKDVPPYAVVVGNPGSVIKYVEPNMSLESSSPNLI